VEKLLLSLKKAVIGLVNCTPDNNDDQNQ